MDLYREQILDHYKHPRNTGSVPHPDLTAHGANPLCGDVVSLTLKVEGSKITEVKFTGEGCAISQAAASMLTEEITGKKLSDVQKLAQEDMLSLLKVELSPSRMKCGMLALETLKKAA
jgi:nitrogen fixation NifU-like protein